MSQSLTTNLTQINDTNNIASIDNSSLQTKDKSLINTLEYQISILQDIKDYLNNLSQPETNAALSVSIPNDNIINISVKDTVVTGFLTATGTAGNSQQPLNSYIEVPINGHSVVAVQTFAAVNHQISFSGTVNGNIYVSMSAISGTDNGVVSTFIQGSTRLYAFIPCAGFKSVRITCTTLGTNNSSINITAVASYAAPVNALAAMMNCASPQCYTTAQLIARLDSTYGAAAPLFSFIKRKLKDPTRVTPAANYGLMGLMAYNPNDVSIYLVFWNPASVTGVFSPSSINPSYSVSVPPGFFMINPSYIEIYPPTATIIYTAASMNSGSYVPVALGVDVVIYYSV